MEGIACGNSEQVPGTCANEAFEAVVRVVVLLIIQKTANAELVGPAQHLQFCLLKISYGKRSEASVHIS